MLADSRCSAPPAESGCRTASCRRLPTRPLTPGQRPHTRRRTRRHRTARSCRRAEPPPPVGCRGRQHEVADGMSVHVVDLLEVVEIDEQHRGDGGGARGPRQGVLEPGAQQCPVRRPVNGSCKASCLSRSSSRSRPSAAASMFATARTSISSSASRSRSGSITSSSPVPIGTRNAASPMSPNEAIGKPRDRSTSAPRSGSVSFSSSAAMCASSSGPAPLRARSPIAATARNRSSRSRCSDMSRPIASSNVRRESRQSPAHLADELGPISPQAPGLG